MGPRFQFDPDVEAEKSRGLTGEALAKHWAGIAFFVENGRRSIPMSLIDSAYLALGHFESRNLRVRSPREDGGIDSVFRVICELIRRQEESANKHVLRIASYFESQNVAVAFTAVRQFEYRIPEHRHRVLNQLVELAAADDLPPSPVEMTLGGIAFLQLFLHDPAYAAWPQLQRARDECIYGCFHWTFNGRKVSEARFAELGQEIASYGVSDA